MHITKKNIVAVILAGGLGSRLNSISNGSQKCIQEFDGLPFIFYLLEQLNFLGINQAFIMAGYKSKDVIKILNLYTNKKIKITLIEEKESLGTGGCLKLLENKVKNDNLLIINGDTYFDIEAKSFNSYIFKKNLVNVDSLFFSGMSFSNEGEVSVINTNKDNIFFKKVLLENISIKNNKKCFSGWILISPHLIKHFPTGRYNFEEMFEGVQKKINIKSQIFQTNSDFYDFGTPNRYAQLSNFIKNSNKLIIKKFKTEV
jgi:D-glycero-alpha-D-manno-heptose 1-phosphate guanylyltransferase